MPGTKTPDEIVVGANGSIFIGDVGATAPADIDTAFGSDWTELGYANEDGVTFTDTKTTEPINVWQSFYAVRRIMTAKEAQISFALVQWNRDTVSLAFGGGSVSEPTAGTYRFTPPAPGSIDERAMAVEWIDGSYKYRLFMPKGLVTEAVESQITKSAAGELPITFDALGEEGVDIWYLDTNDPAFAPAGSS